MITYKPINLITICIRQYKQNTNFKSNSYTLAHLSNHNNCIMSQFINRQHKRQNITDSKKQPSINIQYEGFCITCSLCQDYICNAATTRCDHHFCRQCITQYQLFLDECPICNSHLRRYKLSSNILIDNIIRNYIKNIDTNGIEEYQRRYAQAKLNKQRMMLPLDIKIYDQIDVRDQNFVWVEGKILKRIDRKGIDGKISSMLRIQTKSINSLKQQNIPFNSERIASLGFYTQREELPKYNSGKKILFDWQYNCEYTLQDLQEAQI